MKAKTLLGLTGLFFFAISSGCSKGSSSPAAGESLSADIWGQPYTTNNVTGIYSQSLQVMSIVALQIKASDTTEFQFDILDTGGLVGQPIPINSIVTFSYQNLDSTNTFYAVGLSSGSLTVTAQDTSRHVISATFSGVIYDAGFDSLSISNGHFTTSYTVEP